MTIDIVRNFLASYNRLGEAMDQREWPEGARLPVMTDYQQDYQAAHTLSVTHLPDLMRDHLHLFEVSRLQKMSEQQRVTALFTDVGFEGLSVRELPNQYWPDVPEYRASRETSPWWSVTTEFGEIVLGPRKRVTVLSWSERLGVTADQVSSDDVTKEGSMIHAWGGVKVVEYLTSLRRLLGGNSSQRDVNVDELLQKLTSRLDSIDPKENWDSFYRLTALIEALRQGREALK